MLMFALFEDDITIFWNRRLRSLRLLNQRLWIFAAFGDACSNKKAALGMIIVWIILLSTRDQ